MADRSADRPAEDAPEPTLLEVGRVDKPHGLAGEVVVSLLTNRLERLDAGSVLATDHGALEVESSRPFQGRFLVRFVGVADRPAAEDLRGVVLRAEAIEDPDELWVHELVGARLVDQHGSDHGEVVAVQENPASDLLVLADGRLVPLVFVVEVEANERVTVDVPAGLLDEPAPGR